METKEVKVSDTIRLGTEEPPLVEDLSLLKAEGASDDKSSRKHEKNKRVAEILELRDTNRKVYRMSDGSEQAVFYPMPIHVFNDETQTFEKVEHTLSETEDGRHFVCGKNNFIAKFSREDNSDELFSIAKGAHRITVSARKNRNNRNNGVAPVLRKEKRDEAFADILAYANTEPGADYEYSLEGNGVKENIVVKEKAAVYRYPFTLRCENVTAHFDEKQNRIAFISEENGEEIFYIPAPFMRDANGVVSTAVSYEMKNLENGTIHFTVTADCDFINAPERVFPVVIDPQINLSGDAAMTTYSWEDGYMCTSFNHQIGTDGSSSSYADGVGKRMYIHLNMPILPRNPRIKKAELVFTGIDSHTNVNEGAEFGLYTVNEPINTGNYTPLQSYTLIDYAKSPAESGTQSTYTFDITALVDRISGAPQNYTHNLVLQMINESIGADISITLCGSANQSISENAPKLIITYDTNYGVNTTARTLTHEIGRFGQGSIDLQSLNLMFEAEDFAWAGTRMPVTIKHLYNSALSDYPYTCNMSIMLNTANFSAMNIGYGFKLNVMQCICPINTVYKGHTVEFVYIGENGEEVYFKQSDKSICFDDNSQCYSLYEDVESGTMIYDPRKRTLTQGDYTYLFEPVWNRLVRITDGYGNHMDITYTADRITSVTDGAGREFGFAYNSAGKLTSISAPDNTYIAYTYEGNLLKQITYPDGSRATITYSANKPIGVSIVDQNSVVVYMVGYSYHNDQVIQIAEFGANGTLGARTLFERHIASACTKVTTIEQMDIDEGEITDNIITKVYAFDYDGNVISEYITSKDTGSGNYNGAENGINPFYGGGNSGVTANINNLLVNHNFDSLTGWTATSTTEITLESRTYEPYCHFGTSALRMYSSSVDTSNNGVCQTTSILPAGQYTFSVYLRLLSNITSSTQPGVYIQVVDSATNILAVSEILRQKNSQYIRLVAPFELKEESSVQVQILMSGKGIVYIDGPQLEKNQYANEYNLLANNSFEFGLTSWESNGASAFIDDTTKFNMKHSLAMYGELYREKTVYQTVAVRTKMSTRETFTLSGWAKGYGLTCHERNGVDNTPVFRLRAEVVYADETETFTADFQPCIDEWQFASVQFSKSKYKPVECVRVHCDYNYNYGIVYFDDIQLVRDTLETGLHASDFTSTVSQTFDEDIATEENDTTDNAPFFEEAKDRFGNTLTETTFTDGEFGSIYRAFTFNDDNDCLYGDDSGNNLVAETDARGNTTQYTVNCVTSRNEEVTDRCGNKTAYEYDAAGRTTKVISKNSSGVPLANVSYAYDAFGNMTEILRGDGMKYELAYNEFHNLESIGIDNISKRLIRYTYKNGNGRLKQVTYANGDYMKATYNSIGQMMAETWYNKYDVEVARYKYAYDAQGNIVRSIDIYAAKEYNYTYEEGRLTCATESAITLFDECVTAKFVVNTIRYYYDTDGKLLKKVLMPENGQEQTIFYEPGDDNTVAKFDVYGKTITSHSKRDSFGRKVFDEIQLGTGYISRQFSYYPGSIPVEHFVNEKIKSAPTTHLVSEIVLSNGTTLAYTYDEEERIKSVVETIRFGDAVQTNNISYIYDSLGQLVSEVVNGSCVNLMTYDRYGNILSKNGKQYSYDDTWHDLLTCYDGQTITYDLQGNPRSYLGHTLTWEKGRQLKSYDGYTYTYNANGIRTSKTVDGVTHNYVLDGTKILRESWKDSEGDKVLVPLYDNEDSVFGILYNNVPYYFQKNLQGDVIAILDQNATTIVRYSYDAWGMPTIRLDTSGIGLAEINPYLYRSYYYDHEIGKYYLQSRYYDPVTGRFINGDEAVFAATFGDCVLENNLFQYGLNNPTKNIDTNGYSAAAAYYVSSTMVTQMAALSAAGTSLVISLKSLLAMLWNVFVVVGLLLVAIAAIVYICKSITTIYNKIKSEAKEKNKDKYKKHKDKICVYVLTKTTDLINSVFYVGRTKNTVARYAHHKRTKGNCYMFVVYICQSILESRIVEQAVLYACLAGGFTQIAYGQAPSNQIRGIAKNKAKSTLQLLKNEDIERVGSLLGCTKESDLLFMLEN